MSESPEEQQSTGVLGRIGSWLSPWRGRGPKSPTENPSLTSDQALKSEREEEGEESVRHRASNQEKEEEKQHSSSPNPLTRDIFPCEERDATQSAHRDDFVVSRTKTARGGPEEEEFVECRRKRAGQGKEREESSDGASASGNLEKNASHLTHQSFSSEQGVVWDSDRSHTQRQAQAGRRLHVYLEETSVIHQDTSAGQDVVQVTKKDLKFVPKAKAPSRADLNSASAENKRTNVSPGAQSYYSALVGVSLKSRKDSEPGPESEEQAQADSMGRKNTAKRKFRKNSQGDEGNSPQDKMPPSTHPVPASDSSMTSPEGKSPKAPANSSSKHNPTSQASPEESDTSCPNSLKQLDKFQDSNPAIAATLACVVDGAADMEGDDSLYRVERKTETPESKRRSMKVSRSEVKLFSKNLHLNSKQGAAGDSQDFKTATKKNKDEATEKLKTEIDARLHELKKTDEEPKSVVGRIADKISLFEQPAAGFNKLTFKTTRSADVSPARKATDRLKADLLLSEKRSRSAERYDTPGASSAPPVSEKPLTIKERARNFTSGSKTEDKPPLPQKPAMTGMTQKAVSSVVSVASKTTKLDHQGKLDSKEQIQSAKSEITRKPEGRDTTALAGKSPIPKETSTGDTVALKTADQGTKPSTVEPTEVTNSISPQSKGPSRTGSRSKRRKSREPTSPVSPNSENKPDTGTAIKEQQVDAKKEAASASEKASLSSDKDRGNASEAKQKASKKEMEGVDKQKKQADTSIKEENIDKPVNRQEGSPESSVKEDETDNAAWRSRTKPPIDKDLILPQKEERAGNSLLFTQRRKKVSKDGRETSASSSSSSPAVENTPSMVPEPPDELHKLDKESSMQSEGKSQGKERELNEKDTGTHILQPPNKDIEQIKQAVNRDVEKLEQVERKTNQTERKNKDEPQQLLHADKNTTETKDSESSEGAWRTERSAARDDQRKDEMQTVIKKPDRTEPASSDLYVKHTESTPEKAGVCAVTHTDQAVSVTESDKGPSKTVSSESTENSGAAAEPAVITAQPHCVSVEKTENLPDDSCAHGANDAQPPCSKSITKAAAERVSVKAADGTPALITVMSERQSSAGESTPISVCKPASTDVARRDERENRSAVKSVSSEVSGDIMKLAPRQQKQSKNTESKSDISSLKNGKIIAEIPSDRAASGIVGNVETAEEVFHSPMKQRTPVANGDISPRPQHHTEQSKPSPTPKAPTSPQTNKPITDSSPRSATKKLHLPRGLSKDDSATQRDAPSSWLDVDFPKQKLKVAPPKLSSSGSESNLLDTPGELDDDDFIEKIKNLCAPFSLPPRKHNPLRTPQPPFALPAIREDRFEKPFDPEEFKFGLRKKNHFNIDSTPSLLASKLQDNDAKSGLKPTRASLADRSMLLSILDTRHRDTSVKDEEDVREEKEDQIKVKSRLEGSCVLSSLTSSILRGKRNGLQTQAEGTSSGEVSPSEAHLLSPVFLSPPSPTSPQKHSLALSNREEAQAVVSDSGPPLPSFNDIKMPDYLEKYLPREPAKPVHSTQGQEQARTKVIGKMTAAASGGEAELAVKPGLVFPDAAPPCLPEIPPVSHPTLPELRQPAAQPQRKLSNNIRAAKGFHKRPGKMVLFEKPQFSGQAHEIYRDVADATSMQLSPVISVKVVRGCWVLYEKPNFQGRPIALEEGGLELTNMWAEPETTEAQQTQNKQPMRIGSIRLAISDYSLPHIDLFTEPEGRGRVTPYHDDMIETGSFGIPQSTASIRVHSGVWLVFSDPGFQGMIAVLEPGEYPYPESWGFPSPFVGSLRPLKMGGFKVENPNEVKAVVYEKPGLEGACLEIDSDVFSFCDSEGDVPTEGTNLDSTKLKSVGSLKIIGGLWVGYSESGFEGQQHILEEGEYLDCSNWGGSDQLLSLRPVLADFLSPHLKMFSDQHFGERGVNIDVTVPIINMDDTGYGLKTQSVDVIGGVWVVFEEPGFCSESYILEKGLYGSPEDWGAVQPRVASVMPVVLDNFESTAKFKVQLFSACAFQGPVLPLEDSVASLPDGVSVASCKVLAGSWLAFEGRDFTGGMYVLEVGNYPDLRAMGCIKTSTSILSLQTAGFAFSLPSITLFERCGLWGKRVVLTDGSVNLQLAGGCSRVQSVLVEGGMWVLYEGINYRGRQILLKPGEVPDWRKFSSWQKIGSLRPLLQRRVHFRLKNRQSGLMMSVTGDLDDVKLLRIQETEETDGFEQIWFYENGHLHCKLLEDCCLSPSGSVAMAGSRVGLTPEPENHIHLWSITPEGFIRYTPTSDLVLDIKGGHHYDKNQVILKTLELSKLQQKWDVEII